MLSTDDSIKDILYKSNNIPDSNKNISVPFIDSIAVAVAIRVQSCIYIYMNRSTSCGLVCW